MVLDAFISPLWVESNGFLNSMHICHQDEDDNEVAEKSEPESERDTDGPTSLQHENASSEDEGLVRNVRKKRPRVQLQRLFKPEDAELGDDDDPWLSASQREAKRRQVALEVF